MSPCTLLNFKAMAMYKNSSSIVKIEAKTEISQNLLKISKDILLENLLHYLYNKHIFSQWRSNLAYMLQDTLFIKIRKTSKIRKRYNQVPHLTQDTTWESNKNTINITKQEPRGQLFPSR